MGGIARLVENGDEYHAILIVDGAIERKIIDNNADKAWSGLLSGNGQVENSAPKNNNLIDNKIYFEVQ